ncbi:MAG: TetR family transcriptional regulator [Microbacterium sp.]|uniref:TetR/AcrR family transcriptional regulator C-terminal domain-containing protein n=1 Tax=Microbacterium sp. TaxID=51671 RepID=UPI000DB8148A|nr:TetR/AcrR family transcriptional regulator C-terminal domain-containing protein [Microbacterium sp.]PZU39907.1 MAG: TetR family transcriptional regulator [Microbacterium sp.]
MATEQPPTEQPSTARPHVRARLNRDDVLAAAVSLADRIGIDALSMRRLAQELGVVPMALYKHVQNKDELLDGMVERIIREIDPPEGGSEWKRAVRARVLSARRALQRHRWARQAIESRTRPTPAVLEYQEGFAALFLGGGLTPDLAHHVMHALGGRMWGFTQELFDGSTSGSEPPPAPTAEQRAAMFEQLASSYPHIVTVATAVAHDEDSVVGYGCDDQFEFEFALDLLLDGFERLHERGWSSAAARAGAAEPEADLFRTARPQGRGWTRW